MSNDWIEWFGGKCPVNADDIVDVSYSHGDYGMHLLARDLNWTHDPRITTVTAYRVVAAEISFDINPSPDFTPQVNDPVNHPNHYTSHPSGIECIQITEHMGFNLGNVIKYLWRADMKGALIEDLEKAEWYLQREIQRRKKMLSGGM